MFDGKIKNKKSHMVHHTYKSTAEYMEMPSYNLLFRHRLILAASVWVILILKVILMKFVTQTNI